jgi:hypothetical protein
MDWANFAVAPLKRFIIEFPFVAEKAVPWARLALLWLAGAVHQKYRPSSLLRTINAVIARYSWWFPEVLNQWLRNFVRGIGQTPCENTP